MKFTPYAAFGTVVIFCEAQPGDTRIVELGVDGLVTSGWYFYTKGAAHVTVIETGEKLEDRTPGWLNYEHPDARASSTGKIELSFSQETNWLCIPHMHNPVGLPTLSSLILEEGQKTELENGTNIFLVRGMVEINTKIFTGPCQIRVRSGDSTADCLKTAYGLIFK